MSALDNLEVLEYRVAQLERMLEPLLKLVGDLDKKIALLAQKMVIATVLIGAIVNGIGVWYSTTGGQSRDSISGTAYSEQDKKAYYESRISDSERVKIIQAELDRLKSGTK